MIADAWMTLNLKGGDKLEIRIYGNKIQMKIHNPDGQLMDHAKGELPSTVLENGALNLPNLIEFIDAYDW